MAIQTFDVVTPSYHVDFERCRLLNESIKRFHPARVKHHIIVAREDLALFRGLGDDRTRIWLQEDLVGERFWQLPFAKKWRLNLRSLPVRGWIWQQMVKLSIARVIEADAYMMVDSDAFFIRDFDPLTLVRDGQVPISREKNDFFLTYANNQKWLASAQRLLALSPQRTPFDLGFVTPHVFWRRDVLLKLYAHLEGGARSGRWVSKIGRELTFSEYVLYGLFVERVLTLERSGHYPFEDILALTHWTEDLLTPAGLQTLLTQLRSEHVMVLVSSKSHTSVADIRAAVRPYFR